MNPHEIAALSSSELSTHFRQALAQQNVALALDLFTQVECRFQNCTSSREGSQQFVDEFLALCGSGEIRALHIDNHLQRCVARFEYLLELAGEQARRQSSEETLLQIVESRERGREMVQTLAHAPTQGIIASELAAKLEISPANLSPLIRIFYVHGIIDRKQTGKNVFLRLTREGEAVLRRIEPARSRSLMLASPKSNPLEEWIPDQVQNLIGELILKVAYEVHESPWRSSSKNVPDVVQHSLNQLATKYNQQVAEWIRGITDEVRKALSTRVA